MAEISPTTTSRTFRFGSFTLEVRSGELSTGTRRQRLSDQTLNLLIALLERPGDVVSRDELRQRLWSGDTFVDFEHGLNAAVKRLRDALGDSAGAPRYIETVPKRGYRLIAPVESTAANGAIAVTAPQPQRRGLQQEPDGEAARQCGAARRRSWLHSRPWKQRAAAVALVLGIAALLTWRLYPRPPTGDVAPMRIVPLTALVGWEASPSFSPDGRDVAFAWNEKADTPPAIYVTGVDGFNVRRLTTGRAREWAPAWSPDGQRIAYVRADSGAKLLGGHVHVVSSRGGEALEISDFDAQEPIAWSRDGRYIVARRASWSETAPGASTGLYAIPARGGPVHEITHSRSPRYDTAPAFSNDGRRLAYASCVSIVDGGCDIYIAEFDPVSSSVGAARQLTKQGFYSIGAVAWSRDGTFLVYEQQGTFISYLWRVVVDGRQVPERMEVAGINARSPALADRGDQLAFAHVTSDVDVYALDGGGARRLALSSTFPDFQAQFSPDGSRIVFCSARSGNAIEIWMAAGDGSDAHRLLAGPHLRQGSPHWSPDGRWIAFDSQSADGHWHVWLVDADGGSPRQITTAPGNQNLPTWSRDGRWIYFSARDESPRRLYRVRPTGEQIEPVTETPAIFGMESGDGQSVVFQPPGRTAPLLIRPFGGAPVRTLVPCVPSTAFSVSSRGIFYVTCGSDRPAVRWLDPRTGVDRVIGTAAQWARGVPAGGLAISPDGRVVLYSRQMSGGADLMLVENFK